MADAADAAPTADKPRNISRDGDKVAVSVTTKDMLRIL